MTREKPPPNEISQSPGENPEKVLSAQEIFEGRREVIIELEGVQYRLRITRRNRLILQK